MVAQAHHATSGPPPSPGVVPARMLSKSCAIVAEAERLVRASRGGHLSSAELCAAIGVARRTLGAAFHRAVGSGPSRYLRQRRLEWVREALLAGPATKAPVKVTAMRHGFRHLGHFAAEYRARFGEAPSRTAARAAAMAHGRTPGQAIAAGPHGPPALTDRSGAEFRSHGAAERYPPPGT